MRKATGGLFSQPTNGTIVGSVRDSSDLALTCATPRRMSVTIADGERGGFQDRRSQRAEPGWGPKRYGEAPRQPPWEPPRSTPSHRLRAGPAAHQRGVLGRSPPSAH